MSQTYIKVPVSWMEDLIEHAKEVDSLTDELKTLEQMKAICHSNIPYLLGYIQSGKYFLKDN